MTIQDISHDHRIVEAMSKYGGSFAKAAGSRAAGGGGETIIVQQTIPITVKAWDGRDAVRNLEANAGTIRRIIGKETKKSQGFAKQLRGNKR